MSDAGLLEDISAFRWEKKRRICENWLFLIFMLETHLQGK